MTDLVIVGISGKARSGKSTAAGALSLLRGFHVVSLADGIREALASLSGPTGEFYKELCPPHNFRRALQTLGTEARDEVNAPGLWVHLTLAKIYYAWKLHPVPRSRFVIPDVRYRHESAMLRHQAGRWGGRFGILGLTRPIPEIAESSHSSETEIDSVICNSKYYNDRTVDDLVVASIEFCDLIMEGRYIGLQ